MCAILHVGPIELFLAKCADEKLCLLLEFQLLSHIILIIFLTSPVFFNVSRVISPVILYF